MVIGNMRVVYHDRERAYMGVNVGQYSLMFFDSSGRYERTIGRRGIGPGEFERLSHAEPIGDRVVAIDGAGNRLIILDRAGNSVAQFALDVPTGRFLATSDTTIVVGSMSRTRERVGLPLHTVSLSTGRTRSSFGSVTGQFNAAEPHATSVLIGSSAARELVWRARLTPFHAELWDSRNEALLRIVVGDLEEFARTRRSANAPPVRLIAVGSDGADRLWTLTRIPDRRWAQVPRGPGEGLVSRLELDRYLDTRIDAFDMRSRRHLGSLIWDDASGIGLVSVNGTVMVQRLIDAETLPRVALFEVLPPRG
jgi:hypothetical protein